MTDSIDIQLNGEEREIPAGLSVRDLLEHLELQPALVVVERNGDILRRDIYPEVAVQSGDVLELVHFVGGGQVGEITNYELRITNYELRITNYGLTD